RRAPPPRPPAGEQGGGEREPEKELLRVAHQPVGERHQGVAAQRARPGEDHTGHPERAPPTQPSTAETRRGRPERPPPPRPPRSGEGEPEADDPEVEREDVGEPRL